MNVIQNSVAINGNVAAINTQQDLIVLHNVTTLLGGNTATWVYNSASSNWFRI